MIGVSSLLPPQVNKQTGRESENEKVYKKQNKAQLNNKDSQRGGSLAETASGNQPGGKEPPPGLGGDLVVLEALYQESSAPSVRQKLSKVLRKEKQPNKQTNTQKKHVKPENWLQQPPVRK